MEKGCFGFLDHIGDFVLGGTDGYMKDLQALRNMYNWRMPICQPVEAK